MLGFEVTYSVCDLLTSLSLLKLYTVFRVAVRFSPYYSDKTARVLRVHGILRKSAFTVRAWIQEWMVSACGVIAGVLILAFGWQYTIYDRRERDGASEDGMAENLYDGLYVITMALESTGYGNIFPGTHPARLFTTLAAFLGPFLVATVVLATYRELVMTRE
jgi:hypothetical protein